MSHNWIRLRADRPNRFFNELQRSFGVPDGYFERLDPENEYGTQLTDSNMNWDEIRELTLPSGGIITTYVLNIEDTSWIWGPLTRIPRQHTNLGPHQYGAVHLVIENGRVLVWPPFETAPAYYEDMLDRPGGFSYNIGISNVNPLRGQSGRDLVCRTGFKSSYKEAEAAFYEIIDTQSERYGGILDFLGSATHGGIVGNLIVDLYENFGTLQDVSFRELRGCIAKTRIENVFKNYIVFDTSTRTECLYRAFFKGHLIHKWKNEKAAKIKGDQLYDSMRSWKLQMIRAGVIEDKKIPTAQIIPIFIEWWAAKGVGYQCVLLDAGFHPAQVFSPSNWKGSLKEIQIRAIRGHAQLVMQKDELERYDIDVKSILSENSLYKKDLSENTNCYFVKGEKGFHFKGKEYSKASLNELLYRQGQIVKEQIKIPPKKDVELKSTKLKKIGAGDLETCVGPDGCQKVFLTGLYFKVEETLYDKQWSGYDCLDQMFEWMFENAGVLSDRTIYMHNGGKFDYFIILKELLTSKSCEWKLKCDSVLVVNGGLISFEIESSEGSVCFKDSVRIIPSKLERAAISFKTKTKKLGEFDIVGKAKDWEKNLKEIKAYHYNDLASLYEIMEIFQDRFHKMTDFYGQGTGMDIVSFSTISQSAINIFLQKCLPKYLEIYTPPPILDRLFRNYFFGGRCGIYKMGIIPEGLSKLFLDINSLYPWAMLKYMPYGKHRAFSRKQKESKWISKFKDRGDYLSNEFFGHVHCKVWQKNYEKWKSYPHYVGYHNGTTLNFPFFDEPYETLLNSEEVKMLQDSKVGDYCFEIINFIECDKSLYLKDFILQLYEEKKKAGLAQDDAMREIVKLIMNSTFGAFGIKPDRETVKFLGPSEYYIEQEAFKEGRIIDINQIGETLILKQEEIISPRCSKVETSSFITAYARMLQYNILCHLVKDGHKLLLEDTDSVAFVVNPKMTMRDFKNSKFYDLYIKGGQSEELGKEKDEMFKGWKKAFKTEENLEEYLLKYNLAVEDELLPFQHCAVASAKGYFCRGEYKTEKGDKIVFEKTALKGAKMNQKGKEVDWKMFCEDLMDNDLLEIQQPTFKSGMPSLFNQTNPLYVRVDENLEKPKKFRKIYTKGVIEDVEGQEYKDIYPWKFSDMIERDGGVLQKYPIQNVIDCFLTQ